MLPTEIIFNFVPPASTSWLTPVLTFAGAIIVALIAAVSLWLSDKRKKEQEDRRRWDEELVKVVVDMLVITDDVASTEKEVRKKKKAILAGDLPSKLNRHLIQIRLLSNEQLADKAQVVATHFLSGRIAMHEFLAEEVKKGKSIDVITEVPGHSFESTISDDYSDSRRYFLNLFHQLLVSAQVRKFTAENSVNWKTLVQMVDDFEKDVKRKQEEAKNSAPGGLEPSTADRAWVK
ncbi:hypothetical protein AB4Y77_11185 [Paenarthrobacter sp. YAF11_1]|uniref:hypothetical protein n=1 Tax=Paenarthrobacter sp. YAF11_1 TaxID=3233074 RepID=UPI003F998FED